MKSLMQAPPLTLAARGLVRRLTLCAAAGATLLGASGAALAGERPDGSRGGYLVQAMGCADCHTPWKMGPNGPAPDHSLGLSGHPQTQPLPTPPAAQGPWLMGTAATHTAFWGPWGVSYASNLTPDPQTGIGKWRAEDFVKTMRTGKHLGVDRPLLPPMPWPAFSQLNDRDLKAIFAYLKSQPAIDNKVPAASH